MDFGKLIEELQQKAGVDKATAEKIVPVVTEFFKNNSDQLMGFFKSTDNNNDGKPDSLMEKAQDIAGGLGGMFGKK